LQAETVIVLAGREFATASQAGGSTPDPACPWKKAKAAATSVNVRAGQTSRFERQLVTGALAADAEIMTGEAPFRTMDENAAPAGAKLGEQMGEFVTKRAIYFVLPESLQEWIERNNTAQRIGTTNGGSQPRIPFHL
jgi:hypothetical protein